MDPCTCSCSRLQQTSASCSNIHTYIQVRHIASINLLYKSELKMCQDNFISCLLSMFTIYLQCLLCRASAPPGAAAASGRRVRLRDLVSSAVRSALGNEELDTEADR